MLNLKYQWIKYKLIYYIHKEDEIYMDKVHFFLFNLIYGNTINYQRNIIFPQLHSNYSLFSHFCASWRQHIYWDS